MTVDAMRTYISETYNSDVIRGRHIQHMADDQVKAIYFSLIRRGTKPVKPNKKDNTSKHFHPHPLPPRKTHKI